MTAVFEMILCFLSTGLLFTHRRKHALVSHLLIVFAVVSTIFTIQQLIGLVPRRWLGSADAEIVQPALSTSSAEIKPTTTAPFEPPKNYGFSAPEWFQISQGMGENEWVDLRSIKRRGEYITAWTKGDYTAKNPIGIINSKTRVQTQSAG